MRAVVQRVSQASVSVAGKTVGQIEQGFLILWGVAEGDGDEDLDYLVKKIAALRVFPDAEGKMNRALSDVAGKILLVSQFTLLADTRKGNRPSFVGAAKPEQGKFYFEKAVSEFQSLGIVVETGIFGADMQVALVNDGPVTILYDSREK